MCISDTTEIHFGKLETLIRALKFSKERDSFPRQCFTRENLRGCNRDPLAAIVGSANVTLWQVSRSYMRDPSGLSTGCTFHLKT